VVADDGHAACQHNEELDMSREAIGMVMNRLLTDEDLRVCFAVDPLTTLGELQNRGFELTPFEIDLFLASDLQMWYQNDRTPAELTH
jgi:hypothetical protein